MRVNSLTDYLCLQTFFTERVLNMHSHISREFVYNSTTQLWVVPDTHFIHRVFNMPPSIYVQHSSIQLHWYGTFSALEAAAVSDIYISVRYFLLRSIYTKGSDFSEKQSTCVYVHSQVLWLINVQYSQYTLGCILLQKSIFRNVTTKFNNTLHVSKPIIHAHQQNDICLSVHRVPHTGPVSDPKTSLHTRSPCPDPSPNLSCTWSYLFILDFTVQPSFNILKLHSPPPPPSTLLTHYSPVQGPFRVIIAGTNLVEVRQE